MRKQTILSMILSGYLLAALAACGATGGGSPTAAAGPTSPVVAPLPAPPTSTPAVTAPISAPSPTAAPTQAPTVAPTQPAPTAMPTQAPVTAGNPLDVIMNAQLAQLKVKAFRARTTITDANGTAITNTVEYVPPDRAHLIQSNGMETIVIKGVGTYVKRGGTWALSPIDLSSSLFAQFDPKALEDLRNQIISQQVTLVGPDLLNGKPMLVYQYNTLVKGIGPGGSDIKGTSKLWVGATDGLPYRQEMVQDSVTTQGGKTNTVSTYEYDPSITIEKPI